MILKTKKAFSLVEAMVAIAILGVMLSVTASVASGSSRAATIAKEKMVAVYLAEEAGEYIVNLWETQLSTGVKEINSQPLLLCTGYCYIDVINRDLKNCTEDMCGGTNVNSSIGYVNDIESPKYFRKIKIDEVLSGLPAGQGKEYIAKVEVKWGADLSKKVNFDYHLFPINVYVPTP